ncbi:MAG: DUF4011 domain-containing protein, partial [Clostridia bacterium]|nr:DUF4011 domain-containing protein [Clostridia bacterium]
MAQKIRKIEEAIALTYEPVKTVSYADYFQRAPLFTSLRIKNKATVAVKELTVRLSNENGLLVPTEKTLAEIPFENSVEVELDMPVSPAYFVDLNEIKEEQIKLELFKEKRVLFSETFTVQALPFEFWDPKKNVETLAAFVRPRLADCARIKAETLSQLKKWEVTGDLNGYEGNDKNFVRRALAAIFASVRKYAVELEESSFTEPVRVGIGNKILSEKKANQAEMALFVASIIESCGLHPILIVGEKNVSVGAWLYDGCFVDSVSDDLVRLEKYTESGINNISCFDVEDLFASKNAAYSTSEKHFVEKLHRGLYEKYIDVRRCRIARIFPLPLRAKSTQGYEILQEKDMSIESMPEALAERKKLSLDEKQGRDKQWERRLLDLSMKNALLDFSPTHTVLHIQSITSDRTMQAIGDREMLISPSPKTMLTADKKAPKFGASSFVKNLHELIDVENSAGILRAYSSEAEVNDTLGKLFKKNKEFDEETGSKILYLAYGFLKWYSKVEGIAKYAPLILQPVTLKKAKGKTSYTLVPSEDGVTFNSTLLE